MQTNNFAWIIAIVMAVVAILSWVYNLNTNDEAPPVQAVVVAQPENDLVGEIESLQNKFDELRLSHKSLIEENTALRTLNENLKSDINGTSSEITQLIQQLDQTKFEKVEAKAKLESILSEVRNSEVNTVIPETVGKTPSSQAGESQQMTEQIESTNSVLKEELQTLTAQLELANARTLELQIENAGLNEELQALTDEMMASSVQTAESQPHIAIQSVTEQVSTSDSDSEITQSNNLQTDIADLKAEVLYLTAELEIASARADKLQSDNADLNERLQTLANERGGASVQTAESQPQSATEQVSTSDSDSEIPQSTSLQTDIADLEAEVLYLTAELEIASARADKLQSDNAGLNSNVQNLNSQLEIVSAQTAELQTENSELIKEIQSLTVNLATAKARTASFQSANENSLAEKSSLEADLSNSRQAIDILSAENESLQNELQNLAVALNQSDAELTNTREDVEYLSTRLRYASKHLRRIRKQIRTTESDAESLLVLQKELAASLSDELHVKQTQMERLISDFSAITLKSDVVYESGSARLNERGFAALAGISEQLLNFPGRIVSIEGHTDSKKISARLAQFYPTNWELSAARAAAAANFLITQGVPEESLRVVGYGPLRPIASNDSDEGRAANRRIEIRLVPELAERTHN